MNIRDLNVFITVPRLKPSNRIRLRIFSAYPQWNGTLRMRQTFSFNVIGYSPVTSYSLIQDCRNLTVNELIIRIVSKNPISLNTANIC